MSVIDDDEEEGLLLLEEEEEWLSIIIISINFCANWLFISSPEPPRIVVCILCVTNSLNATTHFFDFLQWKWMLFVASHFPLHYHHYYRWRMEDWYVEVVDLKMEVNCWFNDRRRFFPIIPPSLLLLLWEEEEEEGLWFIDRVYRLEMRSLDDVSLSFAVSWYNCKWWRQITIISCKLHWSIHWWSISIYLLSHQSIW